MTAIPNKELPYWMRQAMRGVDWGVLLVIALSLTMAWPFILQPGLPHTNASENYVYRTADYAQAFQEGRAYPRWSPHVFGGYGAPIPHYYPPGAAYFAGLVQVFLTGDAVTAVRIVYIVATCLCGSMTYVFVTRRAGSAAGVLAAALYVASPYVGMTAPHILGDLPGMMILALLPTLLWALDRLMILNRSYDVALVALTVAALLLTSPRDALPAFVLAGFLLVWHIAAINRQARWPLAVLAFALGVGIAAFFWLPALLEQNVVQWRAAPEPSALRLSYDTLFAPVKFIDLAEMRPAPQLTLGLVGDGAIVLGIVGTVIARGRAACEMLLLAAGAVLIVLALVVYPGETWLLGSIAFCVAIGGSAALHIRNMLPAVVQRVFLPALLTLVLVGSLPVWLAPRWPEAFGSAEPQAQILYEQQNQSVAVLPPDAPVPATIPPTLLPNRSLIDGYLSGNINKIALGQIIANIRVGVLEHRSHSDRFQLNLGAPATFDILTANFPGWEATIEGQPVSLNADAQTGLMRVTVPVVVNEELSIILGPTSARTGAWLIAWATLGITGILTIGRFRRKTGTHDDLDLLTKAQARLVALVVGWFVIFILGFATPSSPLTLYARPGYLLDNSYSLRSRTDVGVEAIGYRLDRFDYRPGERVNLTLYWQTLRPLTEDYQLQIYLLSERNVHWLPSPLLRPGNYATNRWIPNRFISDKHPIPLSLSIAPGSYQIAIEMYGCSPTCNAPVSFFDASGRLVGRTLLLPTPLNISP